MTQTAAPTYARPGHASPAGEQPARTTKLRLSRALSERLRCPHCGARLAVDSRSCVCLDPGCGKRFPVDAGVALLIAREESVFQAAWAGYCPPRPARGKAVRIRNWLRRRTPSISANFAARRNFVNFVQRLQEQASWPCVLVVGAGDLGAGMEASLAQGDIEWVQTDIRMNERTDLLCDAHRIPFADGTFDGVVVQAVLEHVADPVRAVAEIHRVLKPSGLVYAETAFMQQVHAGPYDFTRFTHLGHRRLFRGFEELDSGIACGPAMALAWAWQHFLLSFTNSRREAALATAAACWTAGWLKHLDPYLSRNPGAMDAASAFYFFGAKSVRTVSDREIVARYRGAQLNVPWHRSG